MNVQTSDFSVRVVGHVSNRVWQAHCLEMDIVGEGKSFDEALEHLLELIEMQVTFAAFRGEVHLIWKPAPVHIFDMYNDIRSRFEIEFPRKPKLRTKRIATLPMVPPEELGKTKFLVSRA